VVCPGYLLRYDNVFCEADITGKINSHPVHRSRQKIVIRKGAILKSLAVHRHGVIRTFTFPRASVGGGTLLEVIEGHRSGRKIPISFDAGQVRLGCFSNDAAIQGCFHIFTVPLQAEPQVE